MTLQLGCIADDLTGASDLAGELVKAGLRTSVIVGGAPDIKIPADVEAVVVALKSRSIAARLAVDRSLTALTLLQDAGARHIFFKYCSTFDSTPEGNIGPVLHALEAALGATMSIACPAFLANGRTVYQGHLFVGEQLLSDSGMRHHPLNPMTDASLVHILQSQYEGKVGLLPYAAVTGGKIEETMVAAAEHGCSVMIADAVSAACLDRLGAYCAAQPLSSGASGLGAAVARHLAQTNDAKPARLGRATGRRAIIAGSCSPTTLEQIARAAATLPSLHVRPDVTNLGEVGDWLALQPRDRPVLIYASETGEAIASRRAAGSASDGEAVEALLGDVAVLLVAAGVDAIIVAGGETSGAVLDSLAIERLEIGPEIAPGVPWTKAARRDGSELTMALKSGNFGGPDMFLTAWEQLA